LLVTVLLFLVLMLGWFTAWRRYQGELNAGYIGYAAENKLILIPAGAHTRSILQQLEKEGIIRTQWPALFYLWWNKGRSGIKAGEYQFKRAMPSKNVMDILMEGKIFQRSLTIPEGWNLFQVAELLESKGFGSKPEIQNLLQNPERIRGLDPEAKNLEGYLYPDTYFYTRGTGVAEMLARIVNRFQRVFDDTRRRRAEELGLDIRDIVILASLIEKETAIPSERALISAVFHRRLKEGIRLQCDPTVIYASTLIGKFDGVIRRSDLNLDSPYNTYQVSGLPAGPIANPGLASIEAALYPSDDKYLYFVARKDGSHRFSASLAEHNKAILLYQR